MCIKGLYCTVSSEISLSLYFTVDKKKTEDTFVSVVGLNGLELPVIWSLHDPLLAYFP